MQMFFPAVHRRSMIMDSPTIPSKSASVFPPSCDELGMMGWGVESGASRAIHDITSISNWTSNLRSAIDNRTPKP